MSDGGFRGALGNTFGPVTHGQFAPDDTGRTVSLLSDQRDDSEVLQVNEFLDGIDIGPGRLPDWGASPTSAPTPLPPTPSETDLTPGGFDGDPTTLERADFSDTVAFAAAVSRARYPAGGFAGASTRPAHVVLSRDDAFADSLAGAALTGNGPLLFTGSSLLPMATRQEIDRLLGGSGTIYLLGGEVAISAEIQQGLAAAGYSVTRLAGPSRVETSVAVARDVLRLFGGSSTIAVTRADSPGDNPTAAWADSVSGGAWAAGEQVPLVVTQTSSLHPAVQELLAEVNPDRTVLLGGTAALNEAVEQGVPNPQRIAGSGRAATAAAVATELIGIPTSGARSLVVFNGVRPDGWRYGLAAAGLAADNNTGLVVVGGDVPVETAALACDADDVDLLVVGDSSVIGEDVLSALDQAPAC